MRVTGAALIVIMAAGSPALGDGWAFRPDGGGEAGYVADGGWAGLWLACTPSGGRLSIPAGGARFPGGIDLTVVVDVDGTASLHRMRAGHTSGGNALSRALPRTETRALAEALAKGRRAEVSMPSGRFVLPLKGSGKALQTFLASCP